VGVTSHVLHGNVLTTPYFYTPFERAFKTRLSPYGFTEYQRPWKIPYAGIFLKLFWFRDDL